MEKIMSIKIKRDENVFGSGYLTTIKMNKLTDEEFMYMINMLTKWHSENKIKTK
jgi:hypothetical protein